MKKYKTTLRTGALAIMFITFYATNTKADILGDETIPLQCIYNDTKQNPDKTRSATTPPRVYYQEEREELWIESERLPYRIEISKEENTIYNATIYNQTYHMVLPYAKENSYTITIIIANGIYNGIIK